MKCTVIWYYNQTIHELSLIHISSPENHDKWLRHLYVDLFLHTLLRTGKKNDILLEDVYKRQSYFYFNDMWTYYSIEVIKKTLKKRDFRKERILLLITAFLLIFHLCSGKTDILFHDSHLALHSYHNPHEWSVHGSDPDCDIHLSLIHI